MGIIPWEGWSSAHREEDGENPMRRRMGIPSWWGWNSAHGEEDGVKPRERTELSGGDGDNLLERMEPVGRRQPRGEKVGANPTWRAGTVPRGGGWGEPHGEAEPRTHGGAQPPAALSPGSP